MDRHYEIETGGQFQWKNIPEDPLLSRIHWHVYCAYRTELGPEWVRGNICNHYDRLYFIESGEAMLWVGEEAIPLRPGYCYLIASNRLHRHNCNSKVVIHWCHFDLEQDPVTGFFRDHPEMIEMRPGDTNRYRSTFEALEDTMDATEPWSYFLRQSLLVQLLQPYLQQMASPSTGTMEGRRRLLPVLEFIDEHLAENIRIAQLAQSLGFHPEYFSRFFRRCLNEPPKKYIMRCRIQRAQKLLCQTDLQVQQVGLRCGFPDAYYFSKTFRKMTGASPSEYRNRYGH